MAQIKAQLQFNKTFIQPSLFENSNGSNWDKVALYRRFSESIKLEIFRNANATSITVRKN